MAIIPLERSPSGFSEGDAAGVLDREALSALQREGIYGLPTLGEEDHNPVTNVRDIGEPEVVHGVRISDQVYELEDGTAYPVRKFYPTAGNQRSAVPIQFTTPYMTSIDGHNTIIARTLADELGYPVVLNGPEGAARSSQKGWWRTARRISRMSLAGSAANYAAIMTDIDETDRVFEAGSEIKLGESRAAVVTIAGMDPANSQGRITLYADITAPTFPQRARSLKKLLEAGKATVDELRAFPRVIGKLAANHSPELLKEYKQSAIFSPYYLAHAFGGTFPSLTDGAGRHVQQFYSDQPLWVRTFESDGWSNAEEWIRVFQHHPNAFVEVVPGNHLDLLNPETETFANLKTRLANLRDELQTTPHDEIDFREVMLSGVKLQLESTSSS
jgi:hypothetical protein